MTIIEAYCAMHALPKICCSTGSDVTIGFCMCGCDILSMFHIHDLISTDYDERLLADLHLCFHEPALSINHAHKSKLNGYKLEPHDGRLLPSLN